MFRWIVNLSSWSVSKKLNKDFLFAKYFEKQLCPSSATILVWITKLSRPRWEDHFQKCPSLEMSKSMSNVVQFGTQLRKIQIKKEKHGKHRWEPETTCTVESTIELRSTTLKVLVNDCFCFVVIFIIAVVRISKLQNF